MSMAVRVVTPRERGRNCLGKVPYRTLDAAQEALLRVVAGFASGAHVDPHPDRPMSVYECPTCCCWHIGHTMKSL